MWWLEETPLKRLLFALVATALLGLSSGRVLAADSQTAPDQKATEAAAEKIDTGDTAWMLMSTGLVLLMVPGLALFYGGMVRRKNVLGTMMHSMVALALIGIQWLLVGYSLAFGESHNGWIGWSADFLGLQG